MLPEIFLIYEVKYLIPSLIFTWMESIVIIMIHGNYLVLFFPKNKKFFINKPGLGNTHIQPTPLPKSPNKADKTRPI